MVITMRGLLRWVAGAVFLAVACTSSSSPDSGGQSPSQQVAELIVAISTSGGRSFPPNSRVFVRLVDASTGETLFRENDSYPTGTSLVPVSIRLDNPVDPTHDYFVSASATANGTLWGKSGRHSIAVPISAKQVNLRIVRVPRRRASPSP